MQNKSLGLIETKGLVTAIEAADAAVKSANVELLGYELTKGGGWVTVKIQGDVGAVQAAVQSARCAAEAVGEVISVVVIPRPAEGIGSIVNSKDTVGAVQAEKSEVKPAPAPAEAKPEVKVEKPEQIKEKPAKKARQAKPKTEKKAPKSKDQK